MRPVQKHQIEFAFKLVRGSVCFVSPSTKSLLGAKIAVLSQLGNGPVLTFYRESRVAIARVRQNDGAAAAPGFSGRSERASLQDADSAIGAIASHG